MDNSKYIADMIYHRDVYIYVSRGRYGWSDEKFAEEMGKVEAIIAELEASHDGPPLSQ